MNSTCQPNWARGIRGRAPADAQRTVGGRLADAWPGSRTPAPRDRRKFQSATGYDLLPAPQSRYRYL